MVYFEAIKPTTHYLEEHNHEVAWHEVVELILTTKAHRKRGDCFTIETPTRYVLFTIKNKTLYVINAKRR